MATLREQYIDLITTLKRRDAQLGAEALAQLGRHLQRLDDQVREVPDDTHRRDPMRTGPAGLGSTGGSRSGGWKCSNTPDPR
ncbi:hypothetical protein [Nocardia tengchongensis]|uniref:hypothetical protein n=1 Tax=Nocardia tengchongensis TaxID=2055889 RepID=UPI0036C7F9CD